MKTNDILRRIRYILDLDDAEMIAVFAEAKRDLTEAQVSAWLKKDGDPGYEECPDATFADFLNGLIYQKRGRKDGSQPNSEEDLNNNVVFRKLKIAFNLQANEILSMLLRVDLYISKHELSALFRRPDHKHYRECKDQTLRSFLKGMQIKHRGESLFDSEDDVPEVSPVKQ